MQMCTNELDLNRGDYQIVRTFMTRVALTVFITIFTASIAFATSKLPGDFIVTAGTLNVRLAANKAGKVTNKLYKQQEVEVFEFNNGWARISQYYVGETEGLSGDVARWVFATHLSAKRPVEEKIIVDSPIVEAIISSEDLAIYLDTFVSVSKELVKAGECKLSDFKDIGGWWRSAEHKPKSVYYTFCGNASNNHRIFVNTDTGKTFR
jgi:uncharacterized protein YgiM (DUF1202 family)